MHIQHIHTVSLIVVVLIRCGCTIRVFGVYIKDAEQEVYHCYAFEAEGSNRDVAIAFGLVELYNNNLCVLLLKLLLL